MAHLQPVGLTDMTHDKVREVLPCTCPSGDGSLRWPCPSHPPVATTEEIVAMLRDSDAKGLREYGVTVDRTDLSPAEWIEHAAGELGDALKYLFALKRTVATLTAQVAALTGERDTLRQELELAYAQRRGEVQRRDAWQEQAEQAEARAERLAVALRECRDFLVDMHILAVDETIDASVALLPKVDAALSENAP